MKVNPDIFQAMALERFEHCVEPHELVIGTTIMKTSDRVTVIDIGIDSELTFDNHLLRLL